MNRFDIGQKEGPFTFYRIYIYTFVCLGDVGKAKPVYGLQWCLNIHGHDHNGVELYMDGCKHINLAANVCGYTPLNLGRIIKDGVLSDVPSIHRITIDTANQRKRM